MSNRFLVYLYKYPIRRLPDRLLRFYPYTRTGNDAGIAAPGNEGEGKVVFATMSDSIEANR